MIHLILQKKFRIWKKFTRTGLFGARKVLRHSILTFMNVHAIYEDRHAFSSSLQESMTETK